MSLNDTRLRKAKVTANRLYDRDGLYIQADTSKSKYRYWRLKYYRPVDKREDVLALGKYPEVSLKEARLKAAEARSLLEQGIDPKKHKKASRERLRRTNERSFEKVALEVIDNQELTESTRFKKLSRFKNYVFPLIGKEPIEKLSTPDLADVIKRLVAAKKHETARKVRRELDQVFIYATQAGYVTTNNAQNLRGIVPTTTVTHKPAITDPSEFGVLLTKIDNYNEHSIVGAALKLAPLVFQRPGELVSVEWTEIDMEKGLWEIPPEKKKERKHMSGSHIVPLSEQALDILKFLKPITGNRTYVFSNQKNNDKHITTAAVIKALRSIGYDTKTEQSVHGFRASARTMLEEQLKYSYTLIEQQLSHTVRDTHKRAYNRTQFLVERTKMMQNWADYLDKLRK
ncbi:tyrosine-type recombinase/integrase [Pseudidiomarina marina]|uniref:Integrase n=1 Tax=Pseudidiomarina marina TaxID=502366 RepID=A0A432YCJ0_9GAMM|nr:integrase arm-type DNA-binding domain-containing protein [Pseudidiomarina marina]RUO58674.1 integrase [Pseudidiomarina marina]